MHDAAPTIQLDASGRLKHFLSIGELPLDILTEILDTADTFCEKGQSRAKKTPLLNGKTVANLFFEASTRTRTTFELAAKRLSADVLNINVADSSVKKGESLLDMLKNLEAMGCDIFVVRHNACGAAHFIAQHVGPNVHVINAGDGQHAHPTQAMLDMLTIRQRFGGFANLSVAIVGDILHSRVARSQVQALKTLGCQDIRLIAPKTLLPRVPHTEQAKPFHDIEQGLEGADVIMLLRLQKERMTSGSLPSEQEYFDGFGLSKQRLGLAKPSAIVMHPGPINRGVEVGGDVADCEQSVILNQVANGIAVRMAVMSLVAGNAENNE